MKKPNTRRLVAATAAAGATLASLVAGPGVASAATGRAAASSPVAAAPRGLGGPARSLGVVFAPPCRSEAGRYIVCFSISQVGVGPSFTVHVGIDITMSRQDAQNIIDAPGQEFSATLYGEDTFYDDTLKAFPVTWSAAWDGGLSAEFDVHASAELLNEDWEGMDDEIFAVVRLYVPSTGKTRTFRTNTVVEPFGLYT
jgi:hypothetical protein